MKFVTRLAVVAMPILLAAGCTSTGPEDRATIESAVATANEAKAEAERAAAAAERAAAAAERAAAEAKAAGDKADRIFRRNLRK